jgi:hypothetical protein
VSGFIAITVIYDTRRREALITEIRHLEEHEPHE